MIPQTLSQLSFDQKHQMGHIGFISPTSPSWASGNISGSTARQPPSPTSAANSTTPAAANHEFTQFAAHFHIQLCKDTKLPHLSHRCNPADVVPFIQSILSVTQVSLSVVVMALRIVYKLQQKMNAVVSGTQCDGEVGFASLADGDLERVQGMLGSLSAKTVFVAALMVAMKSPNGCCNTFTNKTWSEVAMVPPQMLNRLELDLVLLLGFDLWDGEQGYLQWLSFVRAAAREYSIKTRLVAMAKIQQQQQQYLRSPVSPRPLMEDLFMIQSVAGRNHQNHKYLKAARYGTPYQRGVHSSQQPQVAVLGPYQFRHQMPATNSTSTDLYLPFMQQQSFQLPIPNGLMH